MISQLLQLYDLARTVTYDMFVIIFYVQQSDQLSQVYTLFLFPTHYLAVDSISAKISPICLYPMIRSRNNLNNFPWDGFVN